MNEEHSVKGQNERGTTSFRGIGIKYLKAISFTCACKRETNLSSGSFAVFVVVVVVLLYCIQ